MLTRFVRHFNSQRGTLKYFRMIRAAIGQFLEFCYPSHCALCDDQTGADWLCHSCLSKFQTIESRGACTQCARPLATWGAACPYCKGKGLRPFDKIVALGVFDDPLKELIHKMKYQKQWTLAEHLAARLVQHERVKSLIENADLIVPVPLHWLRQFSRGYNQSDVIARRFGKKVLSCVKRIRSTPSQTTIHAHGERLANVKDAFAPKRLHHVTGKNVIVVDDVSTTGATLQAVGRVLAKASPASLNAIVLAVADPKHRGFEAI